MKRIIYVSTVNRPLRKEDIETIGEAASRNNRRNGITGILASVHEYFFQILEGDESAIDSLLDRIRRDPRHRDLLILRAERDVEVRLFAKWSMHTICLDQADDVILQAIRMMLQNIAQSHRIIERYTQPSVLRFLTEGINPLTVPALKSERIVLFGDMVGFSYLSERFPVEEVAQLVNAYLDVCSRKIVEHGGEVAKYVGDSVIATFTPDRSDAAIAACLDVLGSLHELRQTRRNCRLMQFLYGGFGLAAGTVIECNIGSSIKMDYTVLGGTVNMAARLQALTREIRKSMAMSESVRRAASRPWPFRHVGEFQLKGQDRCSPVYTLDGALIDDFKGHPQLAEEMRLATGR